MNYRDEIISDLAAAACKGVSQKVIRSLKKMKEGMQSGDDPPLKNIWEEICVQVQGEQSVFWNAYLETIEPLILQELSELDAATKQAIWLQSEEGINWNGDTEDQNGETIVPIDDQDIVDYVLNTFVISAAEDETNRRIERYLEREHD